MDANTKKTKATKRKSHVSSDEDYFLTISEEEVDFLDQGAVPNLRNLLLARCKLHAGNFSTSLKELNNLLTARSVQHQSFVWKN